MDKNGGATREIHSAVAKRLGLSHSDPYSFLQKARRQTRGTQPTPTAKQHKSTDELVCKQCGMRFDHEKSGWPEPECPGKR